MADLALKFTKIEEAAEFICAELGQNIKLATPLGLGKPIELLNLLYAQASAEPQRSLEIYTALSLLPPTPKSDIEKRFLGPFLERQFGKGTPVLHYAEAMRRGQLPENIRVHEFYFQAGEYLASTQAQTQYMSANYTHAARGLFVRGVNVVVQLISRNPANANEYSLSCNPDITLDLVDIYRGHGRPLLMIGVVHPELPFIGGDAVIEDRFFDAIVDDPALSPELFALPLAPLEPADQMIGFYASQLLPDDGTLQIGIGSLSEGLVHALLMRHTHNARYREIQHRVQELRPPVADAKLFNGIFQHGVYGTSELVTDGFMHLRKCGMLKRMIFDEDEHKRRYLHGAFFLGSKDFYQWLRELKGDDFSGFSMTRVSKVNDLYDRHELALRRQRKNARFYNSCMKATVLGGVVSDTLEMGKVVSGVGGQYNFVAMARELPDSHSVVMLRSRRGKTSNIVYNHSNLTIPRHLRDIVITEYGIACLRDKTDGEVIAEMIQISDAAFQDELMWTAKKNGKLSASYQIPEWARNNTTDNVHRLIESYRADFPEFPFGSDFTREELNLVRGLKKLKSASTLERLRILATGLTASNHENELERMALSPARGIYERLIAALIKGALER